MFQQQPQNSFFGGGGFSQSQPQFPSGQSSFMGQPSGGNLTLGGGFSNQPQLPAGAQQAMQGRMQEMRGAMQQPSLDMNAVAADPAAFQSFLQQPSIGMPPPRVMRRQQRMGQGRQAGMQQPRVMRRPQRPTDFGFSQGPMQQSQMGYAQPAAFNGNILGSAPTSSGLAGAYLRQGIAPALDEMQSMYGQAGQNIGDSIAALAPVTATPVAPAPAPMPMVSSPAPVAPVPAPVAPSPAPQSASELFRSLNAPNARQQARAATKAARKEARAVKKAAKTRQPAPVAAPAGSFASIFGNFGALAKSQRLAKKWSKR